MECLEEFTKARQRKNSYQIKKLPQKVQSCQQINRSLSKFVMTKWDFQENRSLLLIHFGHADKQKLNTIISGTFVQAAG